MLPIAADGQFAAVSPCVLACLHPADLKCFGNACRFMCHMLLDAPSDIRWRLRNALHWRLVGADAKICQHDHAVAFCSGSWHPGGVAIADLNLTSDWYGSFRFEMEAVGKLRGDLLVGITKHSSTSCQGLSQKLLGMGYEYILGRKFAPASIFVGGGQFLCCHSFGDGTGPRPDYGPAEGQAGCFLSGFSRAGHWVEFECKGGKISAKDFTGKQFEWGARIGKKESWRPTVAWTGNSALIRVVLCAGDKCMPL